MTTQDDLEVDITYLRTCQLQLEIVRNLLMRLRSGRARAHARDLLAPTTRLHHDTDQLLDALRADLELLERRQS